MATTAISPALCWGHGGGWTPICHLPTHQQIKRRIVVGQDHPLGPVTVTSGGQQSRHLRRHPTLRHKFGYPGGKLRLADHRHGSARKKDEDRKSTRLNSSH